MSEEVGAFLQNIRMGSIEITVRRLVELKNENVSVPRCTYDNALKSLSSIGVVMNSQVLAQRVSRASKEAIDNPPPTEEIQITQEDIQISSLTPLTLPKVDNDTDPKASKTGGQRVQQMQTREKQKRIIKHVSILL